MIKYKIFRNMLIIIIAILIPISLLFVVAEQISENVLQNTLQNSSMKQLEFSINKMEQQLKQLEYSAIQLANDSDIKSYSTSETFQPYLDKLMLRKTIEKKLHTQSYANIVQSEVVVHWPRLEESISSTNDRMARDHEEQTWSRLPKFKWFSTQEENNLVLQYILVEPYSALQQAALVDYTIETKLDVNFLISVLKEVEAAGNGHALFYHPSFQPVIASEANEPLLEEIELLYNNDSFTDTGDHLQTIEVNRQSYLVQMVTSSSLGWSLFHYIPLDHFLMPLKQVKWLTRASLIFLFLTGIVLSFLLYRNLKRPISHLVRNIDALSDDRYETRIHLKANNEFDYLFERFNEMAAHIQTLIEDVYEAKLRSQEANYKQLQSQINPHFLYNCLFYIVSMANKDPSAVTQMAQNLSHYYRFITKNQSQDIELIEELKLVRSYLSVQSLRNKRLRYDIQVDEEMMHTMIPPLLLQPVVENSIVHGIDNKKDAGWISIKGVIQHDTHYLIVEDDGAGVSTEQLEILNRQVAGDRLHNDQGLALWNIHQRLNHHYGKTAGITLETSEYGGLRVSIHWNVSERRDISHERPDRR